MGNNQATDCVIQITRIGKQSAHAICGRAPGHRIPRAVNTGLYRGIADVCAADGWRVIGTVKADEQGFSNRTPRTVRDFNAESLRLRGRFIEGLNRRIVVINDIAVRTIRANG